MSRDYAELLIHELFAEQARKTPQGNALCELDQSITYSELETRVNRVAAALKSQGVQDGCSVGLHIERSIDWVVGILGILKANAAVVPLPPSHPVGWLRDILEFSGLDAVIESAATPLPSSVAVKGLDLAELSANEEALADVAPGQLAQAAFVLSSSGSTGRPKMIVRSHQSFFHRLRWTWDKHPYRAGEVCCQKAHMTTTHAIYELFEPLLSGTTVVIIPDQDVRNLELFWDIVRERQISRLLIVPSVMRASLDMPGFEAPPLEVVVLMGEYVSPVMADRTVAAFQERTHIYSIYGSTEASSTLVSDLRGPRQAGMELPLGIPISSDVKPLVLDSDFHPVSPGQVGRLHMDGTALFTEYFKDPALTASVFVDAPGHADPLFDTHDQVRHLDDGNIEFIGRVGDTVKIRGFRVDLQEVERAILNHPGVSQATVVVNSGDAKSTTLVAFFVPETIDRSSVFQTLRERLPAYMIPSVLVELDAFPLTASGKVDRVRLLEEFASRAPSPSRGRAASATERQVEEVWEKTLGHRSFALDDTFFEVGGDSLSVFTLVNGLRKAFDLEVSQLAEHSIYLTPTVAEIATRIDELLAGHAARTEERTPLLVVMRKGSDPERAPFFVIPSAGGTLGAYEKLAKALKTSRDIIGIRDPYNWGERDPAKGFKHWVDLFIEAIRERQPHGPYFLGAYSSAGAFGYEIARRFRQDGEEVALLVLIEPLGLGRRNQWCYGYWASRAMVMRPAFTKLVQLAGRIRVPILRVLNAVRPAAFRENQIVSADDLRSITDYALNTKRHILAVSALLELNTGLPFTLGEDDLADIPSDQYLSILQAKVKSVTPDVDPARIERILIQYELQVRTQFAYELSPYDGPVLLLEPATRYTGLLEALFRPHLKNLNVRALALGQPSDRTHMIAKHFGSLESHYRSMRDDMYVQAVAEELDVRLD